MRGMREVPNAERPAIGQLINQIKREVEARIEALTEKLKAASLTKSLNEKRLDVTLPGMRIARGHIHPITDILEQMLAHLRVDGLRSRDDPGYRGRLSQFRRAQLSAASSGARHAGHFLRRRRDAAADAHLQRPDPRDGETPAAARGRMPRAMLPARRPQRARLPDVHADRRLHGRQARPNHDGASQGRPDGFRARVFRHDRGALSLELFSIHRAERRARHALPAMRRRRMPGLQAFRMDRNPRLRNDSSRT